MRIPEFVDKIANRFDSKLQTQGQIEAFEEDCKNYLKPYEGEVLGFAFHEICATAKHRTHPPIGRIKEICHAKQNADYKEEKPLSSKEQEIVQNKQIANKYKQTPTFKKAANLMIGYDVLLYIERNGQEPTSDELNNMVKAHKEFLNNMGRWENNPELNNMELTLYQTGQKLHEKNLALKQHYGYWVR